MPAKRKHGGRLPPNLYCRADGYYRYREPITGQTFGLGRDRQSAIEQPLEANLVMAGGGKVRLFRKQTSSVAAPLLDMQRLLSQSQKLERQPAIYFLFLEGDLMYVGQSLHWPARIANHMTIKGIPFDAFTIVSTDQYQLDELETAYIIKFQPPFNMRLGRRAVSKPATDIVQQSITY